MDHAAQPFHGKADHRRAEGARGRNEDQALCRKHGISDATLYNWKARYGGMTTLDMAESRSLEDENRRLKKLPAYQMIDDAVLKDLLEKPDDARGAGRDGGAGDHGSRRSTADSEMNA